MAVSLMTLSVDSSLDFGTVENFFTVLLHEGALGKLTIDTICQVQSITSQPNTVVSTVDG